MPFGKCKHLHATTQNCKVGQTFFKKNTHKRFGFMTLQCEKKPDYAKAIDIKMIEARARVIALARCI